MTTVLNRRQNLACRLVAWLSFFPLATVGGMAGTEAAENASAPERPLSNVGVVFSFASESDPEEPIQVRVYDVSQLLRSLAEHEQGSVEEQGRALSALLQPLARAPVEVQDDQLTISTTAANHRQIAELLPLWERTGLQQIVVEIRFISAAASVIESLNLPEQRLLTERPPGSTPGTQPPAFDRPLTLPGQAGTELTAARLEMTKPTPVRLETLTSEQTRQLVQMAQGDRRVNIVQAPKVTFFNGQSVAIADVSERPFVVGVETVGDIEPPQVRVLTEGSTVHLRAVIDGRSNTVRLDCRLEFSRIGEVETRELSASDTIQIPEWYCQSIALAADVTADHTLLIGGPASEQSDSVNEKGASSLSRVGNGLFGKRAEEPRHLYLLITPRLLDR